MALGDQPATGGAAEVPQPAIIALRASSDSRSLMSQRSSFTKGRMQFQDVPES